MKESCEFTISQDFNKKEIERKDGYREWDSEEREESQRAGFDGGGRRQGFLVGVGE